VFLWMLYMFHTYVASVLSGCCVYFIWFSSVFQVFLQIFRMHVSSVSSAIRRILQMLHLDVSSRSSVASPSLLAFDCLALVSPPSLVVSWASEPEAQAGATRSLSSRCWRRDGERLPRVARTGAPFCSVVPLHGPADAPSVTQFRGSITKIG
jgi:hypothetical protein